MRQFRPSARRLGLYVHIVASVGWLGAVIAALGVAIVNIAADSDQLVRGAALVLQALAWYVLVPLGAISFVSGVLQSLGTPWGLVRYYWVLFKLIINIFSVVVLIVYASSTMASVADRARDLSSPVGEVRNPSAALHGAVAVLLLLVAAWLSVYKPRGLITRPLQPTSSQMQS